MDLVRIDVEFRRLIRDFSARVSYHENKIGSVLNTMPLGRIEKKICSTGRMILWSNHPDFSGMDVVRSDLIRGEVLITSRLSCYFWRYYQYSLNSEIDEWCQEHNYQYTFVHFVLPMYIYLIEFADDKSLVHFKMRWL